MAYRPHEDRRLCIGVDDRLDAVEYPRIAATHDAELPVFCPRLPARDRGIHETDTHLGSRRGNLPGHLGRSSRVVNQGRRSSSASHASEHPGVAENHGPHIIVVANAHHHYVCTPGRLRRCICHRTTVLPNPRLGLRSRTVVDGGRVTCRLEVAGHRIPHHPEPDKRAPGHVLLSYLQDRTADPSPHN